MRMNSNASVSEQVTFFVEADHDYMPPELPCELRMGEKAIIIPKEAYQDSDAVFFQAQGHGGFSRYGKLSQDLQGCVVGAITYIAIR